MIHVFSITLTSFTGFYHSSTGLVALRTICDLFGSSLIILVLKDDSCVYKPLSYLLMVIGDLFAPPDKL